MITIDQLRKLALSFPEATEEPHFEKQSFRVKKKIFATYDDSHNRATLKLPEQDQDIYCLADPTTIYSVDNKWGKQGWTFVDMDHVSLGLFEDALASAYCCVAPKKLARLVISDDRPET
ncbi:MAG: MmcQ/YjbR family DNA-binding protein [Cyclobacteriaceae bacterium]